jgi:hypothetical protein
VTSLAVMVCKIYNIPFPKNFRTEEGKLEVGALAVKFKVEEFVPSDKKAQEISEEISKEGKKDGDEEK